MSQREIHSPSGRAKVELYGWVKKDSPGILRMIDKNAIHVDHAYQRQPRPARVLDIARSWSWVAFGALVVAERDKQYWVIDGQHRLLAAMNRADINLLPCVVFPTNDMQPEARGFVDSNTLRGPIKVNEYFKAAIQAGDEQAAALKYLCTNLGVRVRETSNAPSKPDTGELTCLGTLRKLYEEDAVKTEKCLRLCAELAFRDSVSIGFVLLAGLYELARIIPGCLENPHFIGRVRSAGAVALVAAANKHSAITGVGGRKVRALGMLNEINKGLRRRFTPEVSEQ